MEGGVPSDGVTQLVTYLISLGPYGLLLGTLAYFAWRKDKRCDELQDALNEISKEYATRVTELTATINALRDAIFATGRARRQPGGE